MYQVNLRPIEVTDLPLLLAWGQNSEIWKYMPTSRHGEKLTWEKHFNWFVNRKCRADFMIIAKGSDDAWARAVGVVHAITGGPSSQLLVPEVGLYIGEFSLWGQGIGKQALELIIAMLLKSNLIIEAVIHPKNKRSIKLFTSLGFKKIGKARKGQHLYQLNRFATEVVCLKDHSSPSLTLQPSTGV